MKTLLVSFKKILALSALLVSVAAGLWANGKTDAGADRGRHIGFYRIGAGNLFKGNLHVQLLSDRGNFYLQIPGYTRYILGYFDENNAWRIWDAAKDRWIEADNNAAAVLGTFRNAVSGTAPGVNDLMPEKAAIRGIETAFTVTGLKMSAADDVPALETVFRGRLIDAPLPIGGHSFNLILALYREPGGKGDILGFSRPGGWFAGEADLFNSTETLRKTPYAGKALSLLYEFFQSRGAGGAFETCVRQYYPGVNLTAFAGISGMKKEKAVTDLINALADILKRGFQRETPEKPVFAGSEAGVLYGSRRNIYLDAYLYFCYSQSRPLFLGIANALGPDFFDAGQYRELSAAEGLVLARNAARYYTWGVEYLAGGDYHYSGGSFFNSITVNYNREEKTWDIPWFNDGGAGSRENDYWPGTLYPLKKMPVPFIPAAAVDSITIDDIASRDGPAFDSPFPGGGSGYPLPYLRHGNDTPRSFARKMAAQTRSSLAAVPGNGPAVPSTRGARSLPHDAGVDSMGILKGSLAMAPESDGVLWPVFGEISGASDLEQNSVILPDLSLVRPGDLVVRYREESRDNWQAEIGIVAGFRRGTSPVPVTGGDQRAAMENILLITAREGYGQVRLVPWSSFASGEDGFHLRRLLVRRGENTVPSSRRVETWDLLDPLPVIMEAEFRAMEEQDRRDGGSVRERWIPNTGEYLILEDIRLSAKNAAGIFLDPGPESGVELYISGAADRGYDPQKAAGTYGNIYNNSAGSKFEIALVSESKKETVLLGILETDTAGHYSARYYEHVFRGFRVNAEGRLFARLNDGGDRNYYPGIRPLGPNGAKPGDDLLLEFAARPRDSSEPFRYEISSDSGTAVLETRFRAAGKDYLAVYDKKLLWRANLYIDEGNGDWNDLHPWNAPSGNGEKAPVWWDSSWGYNSWNSGRAAAVPGGQVMAIAPWTRWNDNVTVIGAVAYGWGCWDSVPAFNEELDEQRALIAQGRNKEHQNYQSANFERLLWTRDSAAPDRSWQNYVFPGRKQVNNTMQYHKALTQAELNENKQHFYFVNGSQASIPGLSTYWEERETSQYEYNQILRTSGIDCSGLAHRAALYEGSPCYVAGNSGSKYGTTTFGDNTEAALLIRDTGWKLEDQTDAAARERDRDLISRAVPGDIFVRSGIHVVIIQDIARAADEEKVGAYNQVRIIHSTQGSNKAATWMVQHDSWGDLGNTDKTKYKLMRYK
ncbi:MAG: hypothetical protein LBB83_01965 [Treponema sp.]|jgi:hypothetical protein|nr:hypothetical protein [Treponema sp.]